jgi:hypothetical protein
VLDNRISGTYSYSLRSSPLGARCTVRRAILYRRDVDENLLPADLFGAFAQSFEHYLLPFSGRGGRGGISSVFAVPA